MYIPYFKISLILSEQPIRKDFQYRNVNKNFDWFINRTFVASVFLQLFHSCLLFLAFSLLQPWQTYLKCDCN